jgi:hypothetical protein
MGYNFRSQELGSLLQENFFRIPRFSAAQFDSTFAEFEPYSAAPAQ